VLEDGISVVERCGTAPISHGGRLEHVEAVGLEITEPTQIAERSVIVLCGLANSIKRCPKLIVAIDFSVRFVFICENYRKKDQIQLLRRSSLGTYTKPMLVGAVI
jgi:hypothetical protein